MADAKNSVSPEPEEGGSVELDADAPTVRGPTHVENHRRIVTYTLIALLALIIVGHYIAVFILDWNDKKHDAVGNAFNASLPVVSGLVGSAVAYYFSRTDSKIPRHQPRK